VRQTTDGKPLWSYGGKTNSVTEFRYSSDGTNLALINGQGAIELWDTTTWTQRHHIPPMEGTKYRNMSIRHHRIAAIEGSSQVALFDVGTGRKLASLEGNPTARFIYVRIDRTEDSIMARAGNELNYWRIDSQGRTVASYHHQAPEVSNLWRVSEEYAVWVKANGDLELSQVATGEKVVTLTPPKGRGRQLFFSLDSQLLCGVWGNDTAKIWNIPSGEERCTIRGRFTGGAFSHDGGQLVTYGVRKVFKTWDTTTGRELRSYRGQRNIATAASFSPDGQWIASLGWLNPDLKLWRTGHGRERIEHSNWVFNAAVSADGKRLASASEDGIGKVWDIESGAELQTLKGHFHAIHGIDFDLEGDRIVTASSDETAKVWDANTGKELLLLRGHTNVIGRVIFSPNSQRIATGSYAGGPNLDSSSVKIWDASSGQELLHLSGHSADVLSLAWHPIKEQIATSSGDGTAKIWDTSNGSELLTLKGHRGRVFDVDYSPHGRLIATAGVDGTIRMWDSELGNQLTLMNTKGNLRSIDFSPDGKRLVSGYSELLEGLGVPTIQIWDIESNRELLSIELSGDMVQASKWSPSGDRIIAPSFDRRAGVIDVFESFPYDLDDYPGAPTDPVLERVQAYATAYWHRRLAVENLIKSPPTPTPYSKTVPIPRDAYPARDSRSHPEQLDLTNDYNTLLDTLCHPTVRGTGLFGFDLSELPTGTQTFSNVTFDVRGAVQLADNQLDWQEHVETSVKGIEVGKKLKRLHILHGSNVDHPSSRSPVSGQAATYVMHYADGGQIEFPIHCGRDLLPVLWWPGWGPETATEATIAWRGKKSVMRGVEKIGGIKDQNGNPRNDSELRIFKSVWENPRPDEEIVSIDFISSETRGLLPFLIAITVEYF